MVTRYVLALLHTNAWKEAVAVVKLTEGSQIPSIAYGSGSVNKGQDIHQYIEQAIDTGFSHLDTAQCNYTWPPSSL